MSREVGVSNVGMRSVARYEFRRRVNNLNLWDLEEKCKSMIVKSSSVFIFYKIEGIRIKLKNVIYLPFHFFTLVSRKIVQFITHFTNKILSK